MFRKIVFFLIVSLITLSVTPQQKVRIEINALPPNSPANSSIFIAGSFNSWNPQNKNFQFQKNDKSYFLELLLNAGSYEYKITRGGWDKVESTKDGKDIVNRTLKVDADASIEVSVEGWKDLFASSALPRKSTANKNVRIIDTAFFIPQLNRTRRVWVYLPMSYNNSSKKYPVLYMHDGQNVFDDATSFSGEWGVDEAMDTLGLKTKECIVVGIDNGGDKRLNEYCPYDFSLNGNVATNKGEGGIYVDFLVKTLKPFIDKKYRTLKDKSSTFTAGSSMGGLISMYAILKYPKVFGGAGVFSPAFWVAPKIFDDIKAKGKKINAKIYFYAGDEEGETMVPMTIRAFNEMHRISKSKLCEVIRAGGKHNEARWRIEFPLFYQWLNPLF
ncbi:MAG TPA: alpha/beta hydrolase-fold protein, partial [Chitinophagaceae bacterium]|nr:alpha/beta hydrolase-fold protein [Chitinophagaceae bacterium]